MHWLPELFHKIIITIEKIKKFFQIEKVNN